MIHNSVSKTVEPTLRSKLEGESYFVMESSDSNWAVVLGKYNDNGVLPNKKFSDLSGTVTDQTLKEKCSSALASSDDSLYEAVKIWCTVPKTVQQRLGDLGIHALKMTGENEEGDKTKWNALKEKYKAASEDQKIKNFNLSTSSGDADWQSLRTECNNHLSKDRWNADYDYYLEKVIDWCTSSSKQLNG
ncbi:hypothetical protein HF1_09770 [Mycoplasma haemofelis str. Langford 1]|uniref:Uncharacterized protein n=1 Tax=Mycoplasma haemofelis (strain Langford 1) TaxID=941640 RepID=E8ZIL4_MYCHL|nr:hypothetical protein HF1_09770 [Mycoplasma haemofelis str. Langford 1]